MAAAAKDLISGLPTPQDHHLPPIDGAARTSSLSTRWRRLPTTNPTSTSTSQTLKPKGLHPHRRPLLDPRIHKPQAQIHPPSPPRRHRLLQRPPSLDPGRCGPERQGDHAEPSGSWSVEAPRVIFECGSVESIKMRNCSLRFVPAVGERFGRLRRLVPAHDRMRCCHCVLRSRRLRFVVAGS